MGRKHKADDDGADDHAEDQIVDESAPLDPESFFAPEPVTEEIPVPVQPEPQGTKIPCSIWAKNRLGKSAPRASFLAWAKINLPENHTDAEWQSSYAKFQKTPLA